MCLCYEDVSDGIIRTHWKSWKLIINRLSGVLCAIIVFITGSILYNISKRFGYSEYIICSCVKVDERGMIAIGMNRGDEHNV